MNEEKLNQKQLLFCEEYLKTGNATSSAIKAGYSPKAATEQGSRLLTNVKIKEFLDNRMALIGFDTDQAVLDTLNMLLGVINGTLLEPNDKPSKNLTKVKASEALLNYIPTKVIEKMQILEYEKKKIELDKLRNPDKENKNSKLEEYMETLERGL